jgi:membrane dipeptidase
MDRRAFNLSLLTATAAGLLTPRAVVRAWADAQSSIDQLYGASIVIDSMCSPLDDLESAPTREALAAVRQSGITAVNFTISAPGQEATLVNLANVQRLVDTHPETFRIIRRHADIAACKRDGRLGIMMGFQYPNALEEHPDRIRTYRKLGVRIMQLTYNNRGAFGGGSLDPSNSGLTAEGIQAVKTMNEIGVAPDFSHSGCAARTMSGSARTAVSRKWCSRPNRRPPSTRTSRAASNWASARRARIVIRMCPI